MSDSPPDQAPPTRVVHPRDLHRELAPGTRIDRYEIVGTLGSGGCGIVYAARHVHLDKTVALKLLHRNLVHSEEAVERFFREARAAAAVGNPHIVRVLDCGTSVGGQPFLAMEFLKGSTLSALLDGGKQLEVDRAVDIAVQTLDGLAAAMEAGIVHRDLKPGNIFLTRDPDSGGDFVKILDFGVSKVHQSAYEKALTGTGALLGTPRYMAPEQFKGAHDVDHRADLFAASVVLFQMLSGQLPFKGETPIELAHRATLDPPRDLQELAPHVPEELCTVIYRGLEKEPDDRWPDAQSYAEVILASVGHTTRIDLSEIDQDDDPGFKTVQDLSMYREELMALEAAAADASSEDLVSDTEDSGPEEFRTLPGLGGAGGNPAFGNGAVAVDAPCGEDPAEASSDFEDSAFHTLPSDLSSDDLLKLAPVDTSIPTLKAEQISSADVARNAPAGAAVSASRPVGAEESGQVLEPFSPVSAEDFADEDEIDTTVPRAPHPMTSEQVAAAEREAASQLAWHAPSGAPPENARRPYPFPPDLWVAGQPAQPHPGEPAAQPRINAQGATESVPPKRPRWAFWLVFALIVALGGLVFGTIVGLGVVAAGWLG